MITVEWHLSQNVRNGTSILFYCSYRLFFPWCLRLTDSWTPQIALRITVNRFSVSGFTSSHASAVDPSCNWVFTILCLVCHRHRPSTSLPPQWLNTSWNCCLYPNPSSTQIKKGNYLLLISSILQWSIYIVRKSNKFLDN